MPKSNTANPLRALATKYGSGRVEYFVAYVERPSTSLIFVTKFVPFSVVTSLASASLPSMWNATSSAARASLPGLTNFNPPPFTKNDALVLPTMAISNVPSPSFVSFAFAVPDKYSICFTSPLSTVTVMSSVNASSGMVSVAENAMCAESASVATAKILILVFICLLLSIPD